MKKPCFTEAFCTFYGSTDCQSSFPCYKYEQLFSSEAQERWEILCDLYRAGKISKEELYDPNINFEKILNRIVNLSIFSEIGD